MKRKELKVRRGKDRYSWSTGEVVEALQGAGVMTDVAISITGSLEEQLISSGVTEISVDDLVMKLERLIRDRVNSKAAARFARQTPPFVPLRIAGSDSVEHLSTRKLARSLESLGLKFKDANTIARQVEQTLRTAGSEVVSSTVLAHHVALALEAGYGHDRRAMFEATLGRPAELEVIEYDGSSMPFSRGVVSRSMMAIGLGPEMSYRLASTLENRLWRQGDPRVHRGRMRELVTDILREEAGEQFARRYELLHSFKKSGQPTIVMVGGAPGVGKSTIAAELAYRLGIGRLVSTDSVREALRSLISRELSPVLHSSTFTAWKAELLPEESNRSEPKSRMVIRGFMSQVRMLSNAVGGIINRTLDEASSLVLEGVHLVPGVPMGADSAPQEGAQVVMLMLAVPDEQSHRDHFAIRERQTASKRMQDYYTQHFREVRLLQDYLIGQARHEGVPVIDATDADDAVEAGLHHVLTTMFATRLSHSQEEETASSQG